MQICRTLHNKELHNIEFALHNIRVTCSRRIGLEGKVIRMEQIRNAYKTLPEGDIPSGNPIFMTDDNIEMDLKRNRT
jgi:hypothetical protein